jgi:hypothetical protein
MGGPSVFPDIPKEMEVRGGWNRKETEDAKNRRSVYVFVRRNSRYPMFQAFDMPDTHESCARRSTTVTAPQALSLLNDKAMLQAAVSLAERAMKSPNASVWVKQAYRLAFARQPDAQESALAASFLKQQAALLQARLNEKKPVALPTNLPANLEAATAAAFVDFCHVLLNTNEFVYVN